MRQPITDGLHSQEAGSPSRQGRSGHTPTMGSQLSLARQASSSSLEQGSTFWQAWN